MKINHLNSTVTIVFFLFFGKFPFPRTMSIQSTKIWMKIIAMVFSSNSPVSQILRFLKFSWTINRTPFWNPKKNLGRPLTELSSLWNSMRHPFLESCQIKTSFKSSYQHSIPKYWVWFQNGSCSRGWDWFHLTTRGKRVQVRFYSNRTCSIISNFLLLFSSRNKKFVLLVLRVLLTIQSCLLPSCLIVSTCTFKDLSSWIEIISRC